LITGAAGAHPGACWTTLTRGLPCAGSRTSLARWRTAIATGIPYWPIITLIAELTRDLVGILVRPACSSRLGSAVVSSLRLGINRQRKNTAECNDDEGFA
jgi:hypothetical protein